MEFIGPDGKLVVSRGMHSYPPEKISMHKMELDLRHGDIDWVLELRILEVGGPKQQTHPNILDLLENHHTIFGEIPLGMLVDKGFDHTIELEEGVHTVITTPYKHPQAYLDEIERTIKDLLKLVHIGPSSSPFTSFVVLIKNKDGTLLYA